MISVPAIIFSNVFKRFGNASKSWGDIKSKELTVVKDDLNKLLSKSKSKIIIVIDDVDRLNNIEIRQIFQLIKSLGDFSNTVYLLAFDKDVVINALKKVQEGPGEEYLEKIVQIPFEVPLADKQEIERLLFGQLDQLIKDIPEEQWDKVYWGNIYHGGLKHFFVTIRDVTRYINSLRLSFDMVKGEVNAIDFLAITGIQVFLPDLYVGIRDNKEVFAGESKERGTQAQRDEERKRCDAILAKALNIEQSKLKEFMRRLFPRLEAVYGGANYGSSWLDNWRKAGRVCSPDIFDTFFRLSVPKNEISQKDILRILADGNDYDTFLKHLIALSEQGKIVRFLDRLEDYTEKDIPPSNFNSIINAIINLGDSFPEGDTTFWGFDTPMRILRLTHQILRRVDKRDERFNILKNAFDGAEKSLYTIVHEVGIQNQEHEKNKSKDGSISDEELTLAADYLDELQKIACSKIKIWAHDGRLAKHKKLAGILYYWENWAGKAEVDNFIEEMVKTDDGLVDFVSAFLAKSISQGMSDYVGKLHWKIPLDSIKHFVDLESIKGRVRKIAQSADFNKLPDDKQKAVKIFLDTIDGKIKER